MRLRTLVLPIAAVVAVVGGYFTATLLRHPPVAPTAHPVEFQLPDLDGKLHAAKEWRGKVALVNFWASWCPPCREEIPYLMDAHSRYRGRGFEVVGIAVDQREPVVAYSQSMGMTYPILLGDDDSVFGLMASLGNGSGALPYTVVVDSTGRPLYTKSGKFTQAELTQVIERFLPAK